MSSRDSDNKAQKTSVTCADDNTSVIQMGDATFQVALVTDWFNSYALLQYRVGHMNWRYPGRWYTIEMGVAKGFMTTFQPNVYSGTELAYVIDNYYGNTGRS